MSLPSLAAIAVYAMVICACALAARAAAITGRSSTHLARWLGCAAFFGVLTMLRLFAVEERARGTVRTFVRTLGRYDERSSIQAPLVLMTLAALVTLAACMLHAWRKRRDARLEQLVLLALFAACGYVPLLALRVISWHPTDRVLYGGSVHLNWLADFVLSATVAIAAMLYMRQVRSGSAGRRRR